MPAVASMGAAKQRITTDHVTHAAESRSSPVATWLSRPEKTLFEAIAAANNVSMAAYLRAMVLDVLSEESGRWRKPRPRTNHTVMRQS